MKKENNKTIHNIQSNTITGGIGQVMKILIIIVVIIFSMITLMAIGLNVLDFFEKILGTDAADLLGTIFSIVSFPLILVVLIIIPLFIGTYTEKHSPIEKFKKSLQSNIDRLYNAIESTSNYTERIEEILDISQNIYQGVEEIQAKGKYSIFLKKESRNSLQILKHTLVSDVYKRLTDLRSDLSILLTEQQKSLESAKSAVEKNINGTTELNQVSELQRARLDKQIEQFEELQRVLVNK